MHIKELVCSTCCKTYPRTALLYKCDCGGSLEITYNYASLKKAVSWKKIRSRRFNHWRYEEFYPSVKQQVTLSEGGTPLTRSALDSKLWFKLESCNPSGSFKDRGSSIEISHALEYRHPSVICASTGNMGASVSAYCAKAGLDCEIVLPKDAKGPKIDQIERFGATLTVVNGDYTLAEQTAYRKYQESQRFLVGDYSFRGEGEKSVGFEILDQFLEEQGKLPDKIIVPIGNATLISGIWKGIKEMYHCGLIKKKPMLIGVQARGCNPLEVALAKGRPIKAQTPRTLAGAVACGNPLDGVAGLLAIKESKGTIASLSDNDILFYRNELATKEGIDAEPSGALAYGAYHKLKLFNSTCVCIVSGNGLKDPTH